MIFQNFDILLTVCCFLELQLRTAVIQVKFFHRRNRIVSTAENFPDSPSYLSHHSTAVQEFLHLSREEVREDVEVGQEGEADEELVGGESQAVLTQPPVSRLAQLTGEPDSVVIQEAEHQHAGQEPVAVVAAAQVEVGGHLEVLNVRHHR